MNGSPRRNMWAPPGFQGQGAQELGGYGGGAFSPYRQPSPRRKWVPPGLQKPNQPGGFGPLRKDWWPPGGQASCQVGGRAARHDSRGPPGGQASRPSGGHSSRQDKVRPPGGHASRPAGGNAGPYNNRVGRVEDPPRAATSGQYATIGSRRSVSDFRTTAATVRVGGPSATGEVCRQLVLNSSVTGMRHRAVGKRGEQSEKRPAATDTRRQFSTAQYLPAGAGQTTA